MLSSDKRVELPKAYISHLETGGITFGETDLEWASYFDLEPLASIQQFNDDIELADYAPGYLAFASNGAGEVYVFDSEGKVYILPLIGMAPDAAIKVADSWQAFISHTKPC